MLLRAFQEGDTDAVVALWEACGLTRPWNDPRRDIARKATVQPELFRVAVAPDGSIVGTVMAGYDGHRGWINYLGVLPSHRGAGLGRTLMAEAETLLAELGCPKISLLVREGNDAAQAFYAALGYGRDAAVPLGKRLVDDTDPASR
jgi:ribosomal protein S18 acetylase RimI-like enzyme